MAKNIKKFNNANESIKKQKIKMIAIGAFIIVAIIVLNIFIGVAGNNIEQGYIANQNVTITQS